MTHLRLKRENSTYKSFNNISRFVFSPKLKKLQPFLRHTIIKTFKKYRTFCLKNEGLVTDKIHNQSFCGHAGFARNSRVLNSPKIQKREKYWCSSSKIRQKPHDPPNRGIPLFWKRDSLLHSETLYPYYALRSCKSQKN